MLTFAEAEARILALGWTLGCERVAVELCVGRVLAEDVVATAPVPAWDVSAMDGYAVRAADLDGPGPWRYPVVGESRAGAVPPALAPATVSRIFTGAMLPSGADAVVVQEDVRREDNIASFDGSPVAWQHVRRAGEDVARGTLACRRGTRLNAFHLGLLAALDRAEVDVTQRPRVAVLSTGDELRPPGSTPLPATIPASNGVAVAALLRGAGAAVELGPLLPDDPDVIAAALEGAVERADLVITLGGASVGDHDVVRTSLARVGAELDFWRVRIKPGKPLAAARKGSSLILCLPGNPVSAQVTCLLFALPLVRKLQGDADLRAPRRRVVSTRALTQKPGRMGFYPATLAGNSVTLLEHRSSGDVSSLARANALVVVPEDSTGFDAGDSVEVVAIE